MPLLLETWRGRRGGGAGPDDRLTPRELKEVAAGVKRLSLGLTRDRDLAGARYLDEPALLGAYLLFYWPVSYAQSRSVLAELPRPPSGGSVLDIGSGPGPLALAALDAGMGRAELLDRSKAALTLARSLAQRTGANPQTRTWDPERGDPLPEGRHSLVTLGHVLNELWKETEAPLDRRFSLLEQALAKVRPGGTLVVIEPALRETSRELLLLRDRLVAAGYAVRAPCLFQGACPALHRESDWCHAERDWTQPPLVRELAKAAGLHKEALKMSYLLVAPRDEGWAPSPRGTVFRIVSEPLAGKGRRRYMACGPTGRLGLALQRKHVTPGNEAFQTLARGDVVRLTGETPRGDGLALGEGSRLEVLAPAGRPVPASEHPPRETLVSREPIGSAPVPMKTRKLGPGGPEVSAVGYGGMQLSIQTRPNEAQSLATLSAALDAGVTFIDTANVYCLDDGDLGHNERLIARALAGRDEKVIVGTKGGLRRPGGAWKVDGRPDFIASSCEGSLKALGVDSIDLYQIHSPDPHVPFEESVGALARLREEGKIRHVGLSNVSLEQLNQARSIVAIHSVQNRWNPLDRSPEEDGVLAACTEAGIAFLPYAPFMGVRNAPELEERANLSRLAEARGVSAHRLVLAWMMAKSPVVIPIPGARKAEHVLDCVKAADLSLGADDVAEIEAALPKG